MKVFQGNYRPVYYYYLWLCVVCLLVVHNIQMSWYMVSSINLNCLLFSVCSDFWPNVIYVKWSSSDLISTKTNIFIMLMTIQCKTVRLICFVQLDRPKFHKAMPCQTQPDTHIWPPTNQLFFFLLRPKTFRGHDRRRVPHQPTHLSSCVALVD